MTTTPPREQLPDLTSSVVNDACWKFIEAMPHELPGPISNDLKPALFEALTYYAREALRAQAASVEPVGEPYAYEVPGKGKDSRVLAFAGWYHKYGNPLPECAIPLYLGPPTPAHIPADVEALTAQDRRLLSVIHLELDTGHRTALSEPLRELLGRVGIEPFGLQPRAAANPPQAPQAVGDGLAIYKARWRFALAESDDWTYAVCKWDGADWLPIKTEDDLRIFDAELATKGQQS